MRVAIGCIVVTLAGCAGTSPTPSPTPLVTAGGTDAPAATLDPRHEINDVCPITGDTVEPRLVATHRGVKIAFCCDHCLREFREMDGAGKDAILAKTYPAERVTR